MRKTIELIQTVFLTALVLCSLFLTTQIWTGAALRYSVTERDYDYKPAPASIEPTQLRDLIRPHRVLVHFGQYSVAFHSGFAGYERIWSPIKNMMLSLEPQQPDSSHLSVVPPSIEMLLPHPVAASLWGEIWHNGTVRTQWGNAFVSRIVVIPSYELLVLTNAEGDVIIQYHSTEAHEAFALLDDLLQEVYSARLPMYIEATSDVPGLSIAPGIYVPDRPPALARVQTNPEANHADSVAEMFFQDISAIHRLTEQDDTLLYTDGQKTIRISPAGAVEFSAVTSQQPSSEALDVLLACLSFVMSRGGLPDAAYFSRFDRIDPVKTHIEFGYAYLGLPVYAEKGTIAVTMFGTEITEYHRFVRRPVGASKAPVPVIDWRLLIPAVSDYLNISPETPDLITDMYLAYILPDRTISDAMLVPTWIVRLASGTTVCFDAHSGEGRLWTGHEPNQY